MVRAYFETDDGINQPFDKRMNKQRVSKGLVQVMDGMRWSTGVLFDIFDIPCIKTIDCNWRCLQHCSSYSTAS